MLPTELLDSARDAIDQHHFGRRDRRLPVEARFQDWRVGDGAGIRNNEFVSLQNDGVAALTRQPIVAEIAGRLSGAAEIRLFDDQAVYKPSTATDSGSIVGWHTDASYWSTCASKRMLTAWIPLDDVDADGGALIVVDGSHRWPDTGGVRGFNDPDLGALSDGFKAGDVIELELKRGQVSFHHMRSLHASGPNRSGRPRYALAVHLQDESNHYEPASDESGKEIVLPHDHLCRRGPDGRPDYQDPDIFPLLWADSSK